MKKAKDFKLKEILQIIDGLEIKRDMLAGCGISTARFCIQFREAGTDEYNIIYDRLFQRFQKLKKDK